MSTTEDFLAAAARETEQALDELVPLRQIAPEGELYFAMRYSLFAGGKRLRPALFFAALAAFGLERAPYRAFAAALEMIHTYSLIHDDLPAMDNDDLRRGQPTCHKAYGEALAILAGDALLTHAFALLAQPLPGVDPLRQLQAVAEIALRAGIGGMVAGQAAELLAADQPPDEELLRYIDRGKTGALFSAAIISAALLAGADRDRLEALRQYADHLGVAFQIIDDVLDIAGEQEAIGKPVGSDARNGRVTYASLLGCEQAGLLAGREAAAACAALSAFDYRADILRGLAHLFAERKK